MFGIYIPGINWLIDIQPIALQGPKGDQTGMCVIGNDKSEHIISEDVRKDLFGGEKDLSIHKVICNRSVIAWNAVSTMNWKRER